MVRSLLEQTAFVFEDGEAIAVALSQLEAIPFGCADCLVVTKHASQGGDFTAIFDGGTCKLQGVKVL